MFPALWIEYMSGMCLLGAGWSLYAIQLERQVDSGTSLSFLMGILHWLILDFSLLVLLEHHMRYSTVYYRLISCVIDDVWMVPSWGIVCYSLVYRLGYRLVRIFWMVLCWLVQSVMTPEYSFNFPHAAYFLGAVLIALFVFADFWFLSSTSIRVLSGADLHWIWTALRVPATSAVLFGRRLRLSKWAFIYQITQRA